jgi:hypothetical protein
MKAAAADPLSPLAQQLIRAAPDGYRKLTVAGPPSAAARKLLGNVTPAQLLTAPVTSSSAGQALLAGLWLWHDCLDESHTISQSIASQTGSFWHAIMHRREGDFSNSKYWYARCRSHPVLRLIAARASEVLKGDLIDARRAGGLLGEGFDTYAFVELVEAVHDKPKDPSHAAAVRLQQLEWQELFNACARAAVGAGEMGI